MAQRELVLVPTDFEEASDRALEEARRAAADMGAELCIAHVVPTAPAMAAAYFVGPHPDALADARRDLAERAAGAGASRTVLREGDPAMAILRMVEELRPTLVVMGTRGRSGISRLVMGSVAEGVLRRSPVPVMTVSPRVADASHADEELPPSHRDAILVPLDFEETSEHAVAFARDLAGRLGCGIWFLHVNQLIDANPEMGNVYISATQAELDEAVRSLEEHARQVGGARTMVREGNAATEILSAIDEIRPRLVVMGTHGRGGLARVALGSVAERVVRISSVPVVTVRHARAGTKAAHVAA